MGVPELAQVVQPYSVDRSGGAIQVLGDSKHEGHHHVDQRHSGDRPQSRPDTARRTTWRFGWYRFPKSDRWLRSNQNRHGAYGLFVNSIMHAGHPLRWWPSIRG